MQRSVHVLAPSGRDTALIAGVLEPLRSTIVACSTMAEVVEKSTAGIGVLLIAEEALSDTAWRQLRRMLERQPTWSDLPVLLMAAPGRMSDRASLLAAQLSNATVLERPMQIATLTSAVRSALRTRDRQYELRDMDRRKDMFLATLAHELRNPLAPISNSLHVVRAVGGEDERLQRACGVMERQLGQLTRLVDDLLDVARITRGKVVLQKRRVDLREVVQAGVESVAPTVEEKGHALDRGLPAEPVWVHGDAARLAQCVANLLGNAAKYTPPGGRLGVTLVPHDGVAEVQVRDSGIGFEPRDARRLFEVFAQADRALPHAQGGLGLGLAIVKALAELHGGSVQATSSGVGRGALFSLRLPRLSAPAVAAPDRGQPASSAPASTRRLLVVDDNRDSADSMASLLVMLGHEVRTAYDGQGALQQISDGWRPDLALLDIGLPDISGHELAERLQGLEPRPPRLVALTGWGQRQDLERSAQAGFERHLTKPAEIAELLRLIEQP